MYVKAHIAPFSFISDPRPLISIHVVDRDSNSSNIPRLVGGRAVTSQRPLSRAHDKPRTARAKQSNGITTCQVVFLLKKKHFPGSLDNQTIAHRQLPGHALHTIPYPETWRMASRWEVKQAGSSGCDAPGLDTCPSIPDAR